MSFTEGDCQMGLFVVPRKFKAAMKGKEFPFHFFLGPGENREADFFKALEKIIFLPRERENAVQIEFLLRDFQACGA